jgi:hypothetical protein
MSASDLAAASPVWSLPEFWMALTAIFVSLILGVVALAAVLRARPKDIPRVLSIVMPALMRRAEHPSGRPTAAASPAQAAVSSSTPSLGHPESSGVGGGDSA